MPLELLIGAAVGAGLVSSPVRKTLRKGVVYSLAGALVTYDKVTGLAASIRTAKPAASTKEAPRTPASAGTTAACETSPAAPAEPAATQ